MTVLGFMALRLRRVMDLEPRYLFAVLLLFVAVVITRRHLVRFLRKALFVPRQIKIAVLCTVCAAILIVPSPLPGNIATHSDLSRSDEAEIAGATPVGDANDSVEFIPSPAHALHLSVPSDAATSLESRGDQNAPVERTPVAFRTLRDGRCGVTDLKPTCIEIQPGDSLYEIANHFHATFNIPDECMSVPDVVSHIAWTAGLATPANLQIGDVLLVPDVHCGLSAVIASQGGPMDDSPEVLALRDFFRQVVERFLQDRDVRSMASRTLGFIANSPSAQDAALDFVLEFSKSVTGDPLSPIEFTTREVAVGELQGNAWVQFLDQADCRSAWLFFAVRFDSYSRITHIAWNVNQPQETCRRPPLAGGEPTTSSPN